MRKFAIAGCLALLAIVARLLLDPVLGSPYRAPYITFYPAVILSAWFLGPGPGALSLAISMLGAVVLFLEPRFSPAILRLPDLTVTGVFLFSNAILLIALRKRQASERERDELGRWFQQTLASVGDAVIATDTQGRIKFLNPVAETLTGWSAKEAAGLPVNQVFSIDPPDNPVDRVLAEGVTAGLANHTVLRRRNGSTVPIDDSAAPIRDADGKVAGAVLVFRDVEERYEAQRQLRRSIEDTQSILESISDGFVSIDQDGRYLYINARAARLAGKKPEDLLGKIVWEELPDLRGGEFEDRVRRVQSTRRPERYELAREGVWLEVSLYPSRRGVSLFVQNITERRRLMERLEENERRFRLMADQAPVLIWTAAADGPCDWFNRPWLDFTGRTMEQELGDGWTEGVHPDDLSGCLGVYRTSLEARRPFAMEYRLRRHDGEYRWILDRGTPRYDGACQFIGFIGSCSDIHDMKIALDRARESQERFRLAAQAARIFTWSANLEDGSLAWEGFAPAAPARWRDAFRMLRPADRPRLRRALFEALRRGGDFESEFYAGGRWILVRGSVVNGHGRPGQRRSRLAGVGLDVTDRKSIEERTQQLAAIIDSSEDAIVAKGLDGTIRTWNGGAQRLFGYAAEEVVGRNIRLLIPSERLGEEDDILARLSRGEHIQHYETVRRRKDGSPIDVSITISPIRDSTGAIIGASKIARDITEQKRFELQLLEAVRSLRSSNEDLRQFAYAASHDLQEPLRMVASYTQLLERRYGDRLDENGRAFARNAVEGAVRMSRLLRALLEYSQADKHVEEHAGWLEANHAVKMAIDNLSSAIDESGAVIDVQPLPRLLGHEVLFVQLFQNLISNAIRYRSEHQPPHIQIRATRQGAEWIFSVTDNGIGIEPQYHDRIFGLFRRLHGPKYPGTGVGLAICAKVVESYGGRIWVESEEGRGATFRFSIPVRDAAAAH